MDATTESILETLEHLRKRIEALKANSVPLRWGKEQPKTPGFYWLRGGPKLKIFQDEARVVKVRDYAGHLAIDNSFIEGNWDNTYDWAGPIAAPSEPEEAVVYES